MKIVHPLFDKPIEFKENTVNILVVENKVVLVEMIDELFLQTNGETGKFILSHDNIEIEVSKNLELIINFFDMEFNTKKIITKLYAVLENESLSEDIYNKTMEIKGQIINYAENLFSANKYDIIYNENININSLLKFLDVKLNFINDSLAEKIINYMDILRDLLNINLFVFVGLRSYLNEEDLQELYKYVVYNKYNILLIESQVIEKVKYEDYLIVDNDLCIL